MNANRFAAALLLAAGLSSTTARAQEPDQPPASTAQHRQPGEPWSPLDQLERLRQMNPDQRERLLERLPPERRANIEKHLRNYMSLTPGQRAHLREQYETFRQLPPDKQEAFRRLFGRFLNQPPERQELMREEFQRLRHMTPDQRLERLNSSEFHYCCRRIRMAWTGSRISRIARDPNGPLFRTAAGKTGTLTVRAMWQQDACRMVQRGAAVAGSATGTPRT